MSEDGNKNVEQDLEWQELEEKSRKLKKEEAKVRSLNSNGRVDYSIQEGVSNLSFQSSLLPVGTDSANHMRLGVRHFTTG